MLKDGTRFLGVTILLLAILMAGIDAYRGHSAGTGVRFTNVEDLWSFVHAPSLREIKSHAERVAPAAAWQQWLYPTLRLPVCVSLASIGLLLIGLGRGRKSRRQAALESDPSNQGTLVPSSTSDARRSELWMALGKCRSAFLWTAVFSLIINVLMLTGAIFMLEVYDRVLPSRSVPTLIGICIIASILFAALGLLDLVRHRLLVRAGGVIDEALAARIFDIVMRLPVRAGSKGDGLQSFRDLDAIRAFLSSAGPTALFDIPWLPFYLLIVYLFHPLLGMTALVGAVVLVSLTLVTELLSRRPMRSATERAVGRSGIAEASLRNAEVLAGMGFASRLGQMWRVNHEHTQAAQRRASDITGGLGAIARVFRMVLQSAVLAAGAYLVIMGQASAGIIIAGSILSARALAPVDVAIAHWRGFIAARQSWERLGRLLRMLPADAAKTQLPTPIDGLDVENLFVVPPGEQRPVLRDVSFSLRSGQGLAITGPSGSGKSSLARALVGAWLPAGGRVRLDGATLTQWIPEDLGHHIGYLPQDVELFAGTVFQNIARFNANADPEAVIKAARAADVHDLIVGLPGDKGYDTEIGQGGTALSAGQRQRIGLARALYGDPFLVVLDEPDASLDQVGEEALRRAIKGVRDYGGIVVVVSHRQTVLAVVDQRLALEGGRMAVGAPREMPLQRPAAGGGVHILKSMPELKRDKP